LIYCFKEDSESVGSKKSIESKWIYLVEKNKTKKFSRKKIFYFDNKEQDKLKALQNSDEIIFSTFNCSSYKLFARSLSMVTAIITVIHKNPFFEAPILHLW